MSTKAIVQRPDPRLSESWCQEGVAHDHRACGTFWDSADQRDIEEAARWVDAQAAAGSGWMQTFTGRAFYPLAPRVMDVDPLDIAHALSLICRYGGHVQRFMSVAEHCVLMSHAVSPEHALWALLHDATEAYLGDMVRPLKQAMPAYRTAEDRLMAVICDRFGLDHACPAEVKDADLRILRDERAALMGTTPLPWTSLEGVEPLGVRVEGWAPAVAERQYLKRLQVLGALRRVEVQMLTRKVVEKDRGVLDRLGG